MAAMFLYSACPRDIKTNENVRYIMKLNNEEFEPEI